LYILRTPKNLKAAGGENLKQRLKKDFGKRLGYLQTFSSLKIPSLT
jgi:hypothetical protein